MNCPDCGAPMDSSKPSWISFACGCQVVVCGSSVSAEVQPCNTCKVCGGLLPHRADHCARTLAKANQALKKELDTERTRKTPKVTFDSLGYPSKETIQAIAGWPQDDLSGLMEYFFKAWDSKSGKSLSVTGFEDAAIGVLDPIKALLIETGGHAGNESLIVALRTSPLWPKAWVASAKGGVHILDADQVSGPSR